MEGSGEVPYSGRDSGSLGGGNDMVASWNDGSSSRTAPGKRLGEDRVERPRIGETEASSRCIALRKRSLWPR